MTTTSPPPSSGIPRSGVPRSGVERPGALDPDRTRSRLRPFRTPVRGHAFAANPPGTPAPHAGVRARLLREPGNPADPFAVAVWVEGPAGQAWRIGYLDRGVAVRVAPRLDDGLALDARVDGWVAEPDGRWRRPIVLLLPEQPPEEPPGKRLDVRRTGDGPGPLHAREAPAVWERGASEPGVWGRPPGVARRTLGRAGRPRGTG